MNLGLGRAKTRMGGALGAYHGCRWPGHRGLAEGSSWFEAADTPGSLIPATKVCGTAAARRQIAFRSQWKNSSSGCNCVQGGGLPRRVGCSWCSCLCLLDYSWVSGHDSLGSWFSSCDEQFHHLRVRLICSCPYRMALVGSC